MFFFWYNDYKKIFWKLLRNGLILNSNVLDIVYMKKESDICLEMGNK